MTTNIDPNRLTSEQKRLALAQLLREKAAEPKQSALSSSQQRLWFLQQLDPESAAFNIPLIICVNAEVCPERLKRALNAVLQRHQVLRSTFELVGGQPVQTVVPALTVALSTTDLRNQLEADWKTQVQRLAQAQAQKPFDLACAPLLRAHLLRLGEVRYVLIVIVHHIVFDGWSTGVLLRELGKVYDADGYPPPTGRPVQYFDFVRWQHERVRGEALETHLAYWKARLQGAPCSLALPTDRPRPAIQTFRGASQPLELSQPVTVALKALAQRAGATPFMALMAAFGVLLHRYSGETDLVIGTNFANRENSDFWGLIGPFSNTIPIRIDLSGDVSFSELLANTREVSLEAYEHQDLPFEKLVKALRLEPDASRNLLFQVGFDMQNFLGPEAASEAALSLLDAHNGTAKLDLSLSLYEYDQRLVGFFEYNTDLFEPETIARLAGHFQTLIAGIVDCPRARLSQLPLLAEAERQLVLVEWNATASTYPDTCLHVLFEQQAARTPDATALVYEGEQLSYRELNVRANRLAHRLRHLGVGAETLVGLCVERSPLIVIGMLAILKAGGAYVPLDPAYPAERLAFILADAQVSVLLTQAHLAPTLLPSTGTPVLFLEEFAAPGDAENLPTVTTADHLAYVIYTSGSTGRPKGVLTQHRSVVNHIESIRAKFALTPADRVLQFVSISFDHSAEEIYPTLASGATLVLRSEAMLQSAQSFWQKCRDWRLSVLNLPTAYWHELTNHLGSERHRFPPSLRLVVIGGEQALAERLRLWRSHLGLHPRVINSYGPTEATASATMHELSATARMDTASQGLPIGRPLPNAQAYILDSSGQPVPVGVAGELYLGGPGLARGYLGRAGLTAEKFVPHPYSEQPGARLYRSGDLARFGADGAIEFVGRTDGQAKIRGYRIEPGEVEAALSGHPDVCACAVLARADGPGADKRLVAYLVMEAGSPESELRAWLQERLPAYMLPALYVFLPELPLNANGKLDRRALPAPEAVRPEAGANFALARTPVERVLAQIWESVLGVGRVGLHDNFFELGGDSILSIQVVARAAQAGLQLNIKQLFIHRTIAELAAVATQAPAIQIKQEAVTGPLPLTPIQRWFFEQEFAEPQHWNMVLLLEAKQKLDPALLEAAVAQLLAHHDGLRLRFTPGVSGWEQRNEGVGPEAVFECIDLSTLPPAEQQPALQAAAALRQAGLNLAEGPLMRVVLFELGQDSARLLLVVHHLAIDGVSWRLLIEDLQTAYQRLSEHRPPALPPKTSSFQEWACHFEQYAQSPALQAELAYWSAPVRARIRPLPVDCIGANTEASARTLQVGLGVEETTALLRKVPGVYRTTINDVLLTALAQAVSEWTGQTALLFDLEGHGREEIFDDLILARTVGWFTALFPVVLALPGNADEAEALKTVKEQLRALPNQGLGYGLLRYSCHDERAAAQLRQLPQAEIRFNYLGQFDQTLPESSIFKLAHEPSGPIHHLQAQRCHLIEVDSLIIEGRLQMNWTYSANRHRPATLEALTQGFIRALRGLIAHCLSVGKGSYTPSDFPNTALSRIRLDALQATYPDLIDLYPLSPTQRGMLFHTLYAPEAGVYVGHLSLTLHTDLSIPVFKRAWQQLLERHPVLRTIFVWEDLDEPVQVVCQGVALPLEQYDWRDLDPLTQQERLEECLAAQRRRGFDLACPPLMRLLLIRLSDDVSRLIWSHHHLLIDGWSMNVIYKELSTLYEAALVGQSVHLGRTSSFRDHIDWLTKQDLAQAERFWRQTLAGFYRSTPLGVDSAAGDPQGQSYLNEQTSLSATATDGLVAFAQRHQLTLNTVVQGAWALLLRQYSNEEDIVFGTVVSGRAGGRAGVESLVGLLVNALPIRVQASGQATVLPWLKQLQNQQAELFEYEHSPLVQVQTWSEVPHGQPLFESLLAFENYPTHTISAEQAQPPLAAHDVQFIGYANYPLTVVAVPGPQLFLQLSYDRHRFDPPTITRMLGHLQILLAGIVAHPEARLSQLPLLSESERRQVLVEWNPAVPTAETACVHELFERHAELTPEAPALEWADTQRLSYGELNTRANRLAHRLQALGVGPGSLVGLFAERSAEAVIGMLAILKAGGAYVPLDPAYPAERLTYLLTDAQVPVLLAQEHLAPILPTSNARVLFFADADVQGPEDGENLSAEVSSAALACVMYTSGSTGNPKGVLVPHQAINRLVREPGYLHFHSEQVFLQFAPLCFDAATFEIWGPLLNGARLAIAPAGPLGSSELAALITTHAVDTLWLSAGLFRVMVDEQLPVLRSLSHLLAGGDAVSLAHAERLLSSAGRCQLINGYGPTENTTFSCCHPLELGRGTPIGRPIGGTEAYILDSNGQPVPVGVAGELYLGGIGLARGYLNRAGLTAEKFVPHPYSERPGARLYRSGDLARFRVDGVIEYLGRTDDQVKIRGHRVEPGEVESVLSGHAGVRSCAVIARTDGKQGEKYLVAYVVSRGEAFLESELRAWLHNRLPSYMLPSAYVFLAELPLNINGKLDRHALPAPDAARPEAGTDFVAPRTAAEQVMAGIWLEVLGIERVGIHDNFFELGGHSLRATQVVSRIRAAFQIELPLRDVFQTPTIAGLLDTLALQWGDRAVLEAVAQTFVEVQQLSEDEIKAMLSNQ
ncbi:non-ribosomal peptide synthetase [Gloeobacter morelensis]|uniref:Amino acid adenylation domain-containing protein n=1 Tax=Gloeobacter morelensis MG652769 TaxID=2781736 RepID=A0ABY3PR61_9CYAN|nr:non-ribosomal peptide synthetase [Gloeobacter morelensis]UFP96150.1 amino acid adenylation domain-containing protein [Gloeobacter morelensis MG652769]